MDQADVTSPASPASGAAPRLQQRHPDRDALQAEAHARPPLPIENAAAEVWHWVLMDAPAAADWPGGIDPASRHQVIRLADGLLRVERHTEFLALTYCGKEKPGAGTLQMLERCPGRVLTALRIILRPKGDPALIKPLFKDSRLFGGRINEGKVEITTDFQTGEDDLVTYVVTGPFEDASSRGRTAKRLIDLETYRMTSLLALPLVRRSYGRLEALERDAAEITQNLSDPAHYKLDVLIDKLATILANIGALRETVRFRIAASAAYQDIVASRLASFAEEPVGERQTLEGFIDHRLSPAMNTVFAFERRLDDVAKAMSAAMELSRTRIDLKVQAQNQSLLSSMERRARQQVHLAQAVEGLSVAAITYYTAGLLASALKGVPDLPMPDDRLVAFAIPVIAGTVWYISHRARTEVYRLASDETAAAKGTAGRGERGDKES